MDIIQKIIVKFFHFPFSKTIYITDGIVIFFSLITFGVENTMYSLFAIYLIGIFLDMSIAGSFSRRTAFILSRKNEEIKKVRIIERMKIR